MRFGMGIFLVGWLLLAPASAAVPVAATTDAAGPGPVKIYAPEGVPASVLPFLAGHLPPEARQAVRGLGLLAPATHADFEVRVADWIPGSVPDGLPVRPALEALVGLPVLCIFSAGDDDSLCPGLPKGRVRSVNLPGGHHFGGDSATLARELVGFMGL